MINKKSYSNHGMMGRETKGKIEIKIYLTSDQKQDKPCNNRTILKCFNLKLYPVKIFRNKSKIKILSKQNLSKF